MKRIILGIMGLAALGTIGPLRAAPADDPMAGYYGNALLTMNQPLYVMRTWYNSDHTFKQFKASHETGNLLLSGWEGTWTLQGTAGSYQVCKKYNPTPTAISLTPPQNGCVAIAPHKVGDAWKVTLDKDPHRGTTETSTIEQGHNTQP